MSEITLSNKPVVLQHNAITEAYYDMTAMEKNVFYMLIGQVKRSDKLGRSYSVSVRNLKTHTGRKINHLEFKLLSAKMLSRTLSVRIAGDAFIKFNFLHSSEYVRKNAALKMELSKQIFAYVVDLKSKFTLFSLSVALSLRSKYSKRLYEMFSQYSDTGVFKISVSELKNRLHLINIKTGEEQYARFTWFKKNVLDIAHEEINGNSDIKFTYTAVKQGRSYKYLLFDIVKLKLDEKLPDNKDSNRDKLVKDRLINKFKLSKWQVSRIVNGVDIKEIGKTTYAIDLEILSGKVRNVGGYTAKVFDQKYNLGLFDKSNMLDLVGSKTG